MHFAGFGEEGHVKREEDARCGRQIGQASIRLAAYGDLVVLLDRAGEHETAKEYARAVLELCSLVPHKSEDASMCL
jgi:hypothetical protein